MDGRSTRRNIFVSAKNGKFRLSFRKSTINKPEVHWNNVLVTDESKFNDFGSDGCTIAFSRKNENPNIKNLTGKCFSVASCEHQD